MEKRKEHLFLPPKPKSVELLYIFILRQYHTAVVLGHLLHVTVLLHDGHVSCQTKASPLEVMSWCLLVLLSV